MMLGLFRRRKEKPSVLYSVWQKAGSALERCQRRICDHLNRKAEKLTIRQVKIGLAIFCIVFGSSTAALVWPSIQGGTRTVRIESIRVPAQVMIDESGAQSSRLGSQEALSIQTFLHYLDSLANTPAGKHSIDSITQYRPGLLDSVRFVQHLYQQQLKTK